MLLTNLKVIFKMSTDKNVRLQLRQTKEMIKNDKLYSTFKMLKFALKFLTRDKLTSHQGIYYVNFAFPVFPSPAFITFLNLARDKQNILTSHAFCKKTAPLSICLTITTKCNYDCYYCGSKDKNKTDLSTDDWKKIIADLQKMNTPIIFFTGGEPLLHPDLKELCQCVTDKSLLYILTTGDGLTLERAKKLKEYGVFGLGISLTTCDEIIDIEKRQHGKCYQNAINAIKYSVKAGLFTTVIAVIPKNEVNEKKVV
ncbi:MAG TPA: radical SAM protein [Clostridia bacterium]|nr:radical SAM protein [Clostridia bacterium]